VAAVLVGYPLEDVPIPGDYDAMPPIAVPLQQLEDRAYGTWYVNVLGVYPAYQGRGYGTALLSVAEGLARRESKRGMSIIVADSNEGACRLYERTGYRERDRRPMVKEKWPHPGESWVLLLKDL